MNLTLNLMHDSASGVLLSFPAAYRVAFATFKAAASISGKPDVSKISGSRSSSPVGPTQANTIGEPGCWTLLEREASPDTSSLNVTLKSTHDSLSDTPFSVPAAYSVAFATLVAAASMFGNPEVEVTTGSRSNLPVESTQDCTRAVPCSLRRTDSGG